MKKAKIRHYIANVIMFLLSLVYVIPIWMVFINSIKLPAEANLMQISLPSDHIVRLVNYIEVIRKGGVVQAFFNGILEASCSVAIIVFTASMCAFYIARSKGKIGNVLFYTFIMGLIIPVAFIPTYLVLNRLNLLNTYAGIILIFTTYGLPMAVFLYTGFTKTVPEELDEAAFLDGCDTFRLLFRVIFPLLKPVTMTIFILSFIGAWNDVMIPMFFSNSGKWALPLTIYNFYGGYMKTWNYIFADIIITISPLLLLYIFAQKYVISGMTAGAVKG